MKQNIKQEKGGKQKEQIESFRLQNDEFDPYAIVVLNQLWILGYIWIEQRKEEDEEDKTKENGITLKKLKWNHKYFLTKSEFDILTFIE